MTDLRIILCFFFIPFFLIGCTQKHQTPEPEAESLPVELTLPQIPKLTPPHKPTNKDIQIALKNAGFYKGKIDGDIGLQTQKAIREFQAKNNLIVDGKVGPKTWAVLSKYLIVSEIE